MACISNSRADSQSAASTSDLIYLSIELHPTLSSNLLITNTPSSTSNSHHQSMPKTFFNLTTNCQSGRSSWSLKCSLSRSMDRRDILLTSISCRNGKHCQIQAIAKCSSASIVQACLLTALIYPHTNTYCRACNVLSCVSCFGSHPNLEKLNTKQWSGRRFFWVAPAVESCDCVLTNECENSAPWDQSGVHTA